MNYLLIALRTVIAIGIAMCSWACQAGQRETYSDTDLNFSATMVWKADAKFVDSPESISCYGIEIEELRLDRIVIPVASNKLSSECLISTKDYGDIQYSGGSGTRTPARQGRPTRC